MVYTNNRKIGLRLIVGDKSYLILDAFGSYLSLTSEEYKLLIESDRQARVDAFYDYLSALLNIDVRASVLPGYEDAVVDSTMCPVTKYYRVEVYAERGTASIANNGQAIGIFAGSTEVVVKSIPVSAYNTFLRWENQQGETVGSTKDYAFILNNDMWLKAVYNEVTMYNIIVSNSDGRGTVSGGGTVPAGDTVYISSVNGDSSSYQFDGWYIKGTDIRANVGESGFYTPQAQHADEGNSIYLEARYSVKLPINTITLSLSPAGNSVTVYASAQLPVASAITINGYYYNEFNGKSSEFLLTIPVGGLLGQVTHNNVPFLDGGYIEGIGGYSPSSDSTYEYNVKYT